MSDFLLYAIKSAFVLSILYVPYMLMLRNEKFFRFNRMTIISILLLSVLLPLCNLPFLSLDQQPVVQAAQQQIIEIGIPIKTNYVVVATEKSHSISWFQVVSIIYLIGMAVVLLIRSIQFCRMGMVIRGGTLWKEKQDGINIYCHADEVAPFSWLNNIVIGKNDYDSNGHEIILHEKGHILCRHSLDIIFLTLVQMLQWWNPLVYILGLSLRDVHEYEADDYVLREGVSLNGYQKILITKAIESSSYTFANNFNHSLIKKRIFMMSKKNSNPWRRSKALYFIPMVAIALSAFATPKFIAPIEEAVENLNDNPVMVEPVDTCNAEINPDDYTILIDGKVSTSEELKNLDKSTIAHATIIDDVDKVKQQFGNQMTKPAIVIQTMTEKDDNVAKGKAKYVRVMKDEYNRIIGFKPTNESIGNPVGGQINEVPVDHVYIFNGTEGGNVYDVTLDQCRQATEDEVANIEKLHYNQYLLTTSPDGSAKFNNKDKGGLLILSIISESELKAKQEEYANASPSTIEVKQDNGVNSKSIKIEIKENGDVLFGEDGKKMRVVSDEELKQEIRNLSNTTLQAKVTTTDMNAAQEQLDAVRDIFRLAEKVQVTYKMEKEK